MTAPLRVLFIAPHPVEGPSTRFRLVQYFDFLSANGIECTFRPFVTSTEAAAIYLSDNTTRKILVTLKATLRRIGDVARAGQYDLVYILREAFPFGPPVIERLLHRRARRMIFDFDDAIHLPSSAYDNPLDRFRDWSKPTKLIRAADIVIPGSALLADLAVAAGAEPARVRTLPTVVDAQSFKPADPPRQGPGVTIGWIGTPRNTSYLVSMMPVFRRVCAAHPDVEFVFVGAERFECSGARIAFRDWSLEREIADLQSFDIGIMPLPDTEATRGKCGFKLIEYMSVGIPAVASPVGANLDIVEPGSTGYLPAEEDDWVAALSTLVSDGDARRRMGAMGRLRVEDLFCSDVVAPKLLSAIRRAVASSAGDADAG